MFKLNRQYYRESVCLGIFNSYQLAQKAKNIYIENLLNNGDIFYGDDVRSKHIETQVKIDSILTCVEDSTNITTNQSDLYVIFNLIDVPARLNIGLPLVCGSYTTFKLALNRIYSQIVDENRLAYVDFNIFQLNQLYNYSQNKMYCPNGYEICRFNIYQHTVVSYNDYNYDYGQSKFNTNAYIQDNLQSIREWIDELIHQSQLYKTQLNQRLQDGNDTMPILPLVITSKYWSGYKYLHQVLKVLKNYHKTYPLIASWSEFLQSAKADYDQLQLKKPPHELIPHRRAFELISLKYRSQLID